MSTLYKVIVTGPFNSGKTAFIGAISDIAVVTTERKITTEDRGIKAETTVAMDYGRVELDGKILHLNGTPGQARFDFMWEILAREMNGFIVLVDSTDPVSFPDAADLIRLFSGFHAVPYLVAATKTDLPGAVSLAELRRRINPGDVTVMPCVATQKTSVRQVLLQIIDLIDRRRGG
ncbi:MAG: GTP-binding protein [Chloroflexi bacterium]|nr:GTP-binding protein [Chloroflexota bacterium]